MSLEPGSHLHQHRYRIRRQLGKGGMGTVYLAEDLNLAGRLVAIKENLNNDEEAQRQFRREAVLLAHLRHPNLPQVIDYFLEPGGRQYLVMEYVPGENLHEIMRANGPLPVSEALACIEQIMLAVAYMHNQRDPESGHRRAIVHRDIKPANIKRTPEGRYLLVDFGIAKQHSATLRSTAVSARALTPGFAPIEQYGGGTDERSDIYALGATLYVLLTAKTPPSSVDLAAGVPLPSLRSANSKIPPDVAKAVERAMKVNASERYASVDEMYSAVTGRPIPSSPITTSPAPSRAGSTRPNRTFAWLFGALALLSVVGIWWLFASSAPQPDLDAQAAFVATATNALPTSATALPTRDAIVVATLDDAVLPAPTPDAATIAAANTTITSFLATVGVTVAGVTPPSMRTPLPTSTPMATSTPRPTNTPTSTPISMPTRALATVAAPAPADSAAGGPTLAQIIQPGDNHSSNTATLFKWVADAPLATGQEFEIIFWKANGETEAQARGILRSSPASEVTQPVDVLAPDAYKWALILVQTEPGYRRLRTLAGPYTFTVPSSGGEPKPPPKSSPPPHRPGSN
ncbi:MAG TPA: serine/threonine protein kinase [Chloroflexi bacterium]|nr:serine/threonine protein kinase [Chloroflexota bacterium]